MKFLKKSTIVLLTGILLTVFLILHGGNSFATDEITIYHGSLEKEKSFNITEQETIDYIKNICENFQFKKVLKEDMLEGMCTIFIDFNNGTVIGMYTSEDYGNIEKRKKTVGTAVYLPPNFNAYISELIENNLEK